MEGVILIVGIAVSYYLAKLGKTAVQGVAIFMVTMGAFLLASFYFRQKENFYEQTHNCSFIGVSVSRLFWCES